MKLLLKLLLYKESTVRPDQVTAPDQFLQLLCDSVPLKDLTELEVWKTENRSVLNSLM